MNVKEEIFKSIQDIVNKSIEDLKVDHTYQSVIKRITPRGYVVIDETGQERIAKCSIPGVDLKIGDSVFIKIPNNNLRKVYISGVGEKTTGITATKIGSSTVGSTKRPVFVDNGNIVPCSSTIGNPAVPIYVNNGEISACTSSLITYSSTEPLGMNWGATWIDS